MRRRLCGEHQRPEIAGGHRLRVGDPAQSRPSRRRGGRSAGGRRRRNIDPDTAPASGGLGRRRGPDPAASGRLWRRHVLPAAGRPDRGGGHRPVRALHPGRRPAADRLAGCPRGHRCAGTIRPGPHAGDPPSHRGAGRRHPGSGCFRAQAAGHPQADPEPAGRPGQEVRHARHDGLLPAVVLEPDGGLQGPAARAAGRRVLPRPDRSADGVRRWRWSTSAFPPTPSRRGGWRTPTATSPTTARSTPTAAMSTG